MKHVFLVFCFTIVFNCTGKKEVNAYQNYPFIEKVSVRDTCFGNVIGDSYRNIENLQDTVVINWFEAQDAHTEKFLGQFINQERISDQIKSYYFNKEQAVSSVKYTNFGSVFFLKADIKNSIEKLYYRKNKNAEDVLLFDPRVFKKNLNREYTINYIQPSWDGQYVVVSLNYDGLKSSDIIIVNVKSQEVLPEVISNTAPDIYLGISWLPDSSGFLYLYIPILDYNDENYMLNSSTVLHKLGDNPNKRRIVFSSKSKPEITEEDLPIAKILSPKDKYLIGYKASVENYWSAFYADINDLDKEVIHWKPLYSSNEKVYADYGYFIKDKFFYISGKEADNRNISSFDIIKDVLPSPTVLVPEKEDEVISSLQITSNSLYYTTSKYGVESFLYEYKDNQVSKLKLPHASGAINIYSSSNENFNLYLGIDGWTVDYKRYIFDGSQFQLDPLSNHQSYPEFEALEVKEIQIISHDGAEVPVSLIYRKDIKMDGTSPVLLYTYGAYGESITPYFSPIYLNWVLNGGVFVVPHIRGGGEKGDSWHKAGMKSNKSNSWKDIIACTEYLIEQKYTSKEKTVLYSSSAGTVSTGMAMVERPDLFSVFIAVVPMLNPLRSEARANNASNYLEYGTIKDSIECMSLIKMDPYVNLQPNTTYPASLIIASFNDARIDAWIPGKFAAKLQESSNSGAPVFLDIIYDAGHGGGDTMEEQIEEYARVFAFAYWQTNHSLK
ncbi:oligopeptidase B [Jejuia pallidilutea]|uniref:Oligopeptidase B n=1 Tax=Jejuia pallidilutea TaxID=504487 RepID=A0A362X3K7_9FLAO|nr:prolyl oligopeptidase family serine peptidase [Jejuia pallidilutea]PQV48814.1 oligopeptidase B [Jejuia pallidilutea]